MFFLCDFEVLPIYIYNFKVTQEEHDVFQTSKNKKTKK